MRARLGFLHFVVALLAGSDVVHAACVDTTNLAHSTISIIRHLDDAEHDRSPDVIALQASGWFLSPTTIVTLEHVTSAMKLSADDWTMLEIVSETGSQFIAARLQRLAGGESERLAVVEPKAPFPARGASQSGASRLGRKSRL
jgi:hypothetical protein